MYFIKNIPKHRAPVVQQINGIKGQNYIFHDRV